MTVPKVLTRISGSLGHSSWIWIALLLAVTILCYLPSLEGPFFSDDSRYLTENEVLKTLRLSELHRLLSEPMPHGEYLPLRDLILRLEYEVFGVKPLGYHLTSLALFAACIVLVWKFMSVVFVACAGANSQTSLTALLGAAFFACHPANVEAVAWIASQKDLLAAVFVLLCLLAFTRALDTDSGSFTWLTISWLALAAALLSKTSALATPLAATLLLLIHRSAIGRRLGTFARAVLPMVALSALSLWAGVRHYQASKVALPIELTLQELLQRAFAILGTQTRIALLPAGLRLTYDVLDPTHLAKFASLGALTFGSSVLAAAALWRRPTPVALGLAWFPVFLIPYLHIKTLWTWSFAAERYLLLPLIGLALIASTVAVRILRQSTGAVRKRFILLLIAFLLLLGFALTFLRAREFGSTRRLVAANSSTAPGYYFSRYVEIEYLLPNTEFGVVLKAAESVVDPGARECLLLWVEAARGVSNITDDHDLREALDSNLLFHSKSRDLYRSANPSDVPRLMFAKQLLEEARKIYSTLRRIDPDNTTLIYNQALLEMTSGNPKAAEALFRKAIGSSELPAQSLSAAWNNLGLALQDQGDWSEAERAFLNALQLDPNEWKAALNLLLMPKREDLQVSRAFLLRELESRAKRSGLEHSEVVRIMQEADSN